MILCLGCRGVAIVIHAQRQDFTLSRCDDSWLQLVTLTKRNRVSWSGLKFGPHIQPPPHKSCAHSCLPQKAGSEVSVVSRGSSRRGPDWKLAAHSSKEIRRTCLLMSTDGGTTKHVSVLNCLATLHCRQAVSLCNALLQKCSHLSTSAA